MNKLILSILLAVTGLATLPASALAGPGSRHSQSGRFSHTCRVCGGGVYQVRYFAGRARDGCAIYRWRTVHECRPARGGHGHEHHLGGHQHNGHDHGRGGDSGGRGHRR